MNKLRTLLLELQAMLKDYNEKNIIKNDNTQNTHVMQQLPSSNDNWFKLD